MSRLVWIIMLVVLLSTNIFAAEVKLNKTKLNITKGKTQTLVLKNAKKSKVKWSSSNKKVCKVSKTGKLSAKKIGSAVITAKYKGKRYTCRVNVKSKKGKYEIDTSLMTDKEKEVLLNILKLKKKFKQGAKLTNSYYYIWHGGTYSGGYGCVAFASEASDLAFGTTLAHKHSSFSKIRVGDVVRVADEHSFIVLQKKGNNLLVAEGNVNKKVKWNSVYTKSHLKKKGFYVLTRW